MLTIEAIGNAIRTERKRQNLTQTQLAGLCGVGVRFLRELEYGKPTCQVEKALIVLDVLGFDVRLVHPAKKNDAPQ